MGSSLEAIMNNFKGGELGLLEFFLSTMFSVAVGIIAMLLYRIYFYRVFDRNESLAKSFVIIAPAVCAIFWAIQYSLPLSLGLLGALSFVRFRAPIKKGEDIGFILAVIALSLLTSIYRFYAAGILLFVLTAIVLVKKFLLEGERRLFNSNTVMTAFISSKSGDVKQADAAISQCLQELFPKPKQFKSALTDAIRRDQGYNLHYALSVKDTETTPVPQIIGALQKLDQVTNVEVFVENNA